MRLRKLISKSRRKPPNSERRSTKQKRPEGREKPIEQRKPEKPIAGRDLRDKLKRVVKRTSMAMSMTMNRTTTALVTK